MASNGATTLTSSPAASSSASYAAPLMVSSVPCRCADRLQLEIEIASFAQTANKHPPIGVPVTFAPGFLQLQPMPMTS